MVPPPKKFIFLKGGQEEHILSHGQYCIKVYKSSLCYTGTNSKSVPILRRRLWMRMEKADKILQLIAIRTGGLYRPRMDSAHLPCLER